MKRRLQTLLLPALLVALCGLTGCTLAAPRADAGADREDFDAVGSSLVPNPGQPNGEDGLRLLRRPTQPVFELVVVHVRIPKESAGATRGVWKYLREEISSGVTQLALRDNGFRVGIGHSDWWDPIRATFERIDGQVTTTAQPVRMPAGFPLALELDTEPHDQTLFYVGRDGVLSGNTWTNSRNVLQVLYGNDPTDPQQVLLSVVPEVRKQDEGLKIVQTPNGLWQVPRREQMTFDAAGFETVLAPGEFIVIGPSVGDLTKGLVGDSFLRQEQEGTHYVSYIILRPEVVGVGTDE